MRIDVSDERETQSGETPGGPVDDPRFEVKWRKRETRSSSPTPAVPVVGDEEDIGSLRRQLSEAQEQIGNLRDRWQRSAADLANLRKRTEQDKEDVEKFASMLLVAELLPVLDNFERALKTIPGNLGMLTWIQGVALIERHLQAILEQRGVEAIEAQGKAFSPHLHEAIAEREASEVAPGTIVRVYQTGYTMHGRTIRPALVEVASAPAIQAANDEGGEPARKGKEDSVGAHGESSPVSAEPSEASPARPPQAAGEVDVEVAEGAGEDGQKP
jgi:molecular chaperone GrpE